MPDQKPTLRNVPPSDPVLAMILAAGIVVFSLFYAGTGNALFMRLFYGSGEHAPHIIDSKRGLLSNGNTIPPFLDLLRVAMNIVPLFVFAVGFFLFLLWIRRRRG